MTFDTISVVGLGYIGLPTAAMFASRKKRVIGLDVNKNTVNTINRGEIQVLEPELDVLVNAAVTGGYLRATSVAEATDAFLIAVPTPFKENSGDIPKPDLSYIRAAAMSIAPVLKKGDLVVLESTSPVGTTEQLAEWLAEVRPDLNFPQMVDGDADINVAYCPERVLPGHIITELVQNDRVIGGMSPRCSERAVELYSCFVKGECVVTNARTAEMVKLTENSCRDVQIAFANELSVICNKLEIDVWELISLANRHPRINILQPGPGVGGHCIAVDPWFIVSKTPEEAKLIRTAREVNDSKPEWVINKVKVAVTEYLQSNPETTAKKITIACYGLAFKADIDDLRESPALEITHRLAKEHPGTVLAVEPNIRELPESLKGEFKLVSGTIAEESAEIIVILVDHLQFKVDQIDATIRKKKIIDTRGIWGN